MSMMITRVRWLWPLIITFSTVGVMLFTFGDFASPIRPVIALWFLCVCPGMAFVRILRFPSGLATVTLAIALSLALDMLVAEGMLYAGLWSPRMIIAVLAGISVIGAVIQLRCDRREGKEAP